MLQEMRAKKLEEDVASLTERVASLSATDKEVKALSAQRQQLCNELSRRLEEQKAATEESVQRFKSNFECFVGMVRLLWFGFWKRNENSLSIDHLIMSDNLQLCS